MTVPPLPTLLLASALVLLSRGASSVSGDITYIHDPSGIVYAPWVLGNKYNYLLASTGTRILLRGSTDGIKWVYYGNAFSSEPSWWRTKVPKLASDGSVWAPDILTLSDGSLMMYYSVSSFGSQISCIGAAKATKGSFTAWEDKGAVLCSTTNGAYNAIDPHVFWDSDGKLWMSYGSFWTGIAIIQLNPTSPYQTLSTSSSSTIAARATWGGAIEAVWIQKIGSYYYLFVNWDACCNGVNSTYKIKYGRSSNPNGPFVDKSGTKMTVGGGTAWQSTSGNVIGPGHVGIIDVDGSLGVTNHYYDKSNSGTPTLQIQGISTDSSGWPIVGSSTSCSLSSLPTGASDWGTCSKSVSSGSSCSYKCATGYSAVAGSCANGWWTKQPSCIASSCSLSSLPTGASGWGSCSTAVSSGSSCSFKCDSTYTAVAGYCSAGSWSTSPTCTSCSASKTCGTQTCGSFWNGCATISCGNCSSSSYCDGKVCKALDTITEWTQVLPDSYTSKNWKISGNTLKLSNLTLPTTQRVITYTGNQTSWFSGGYTTATIQINATEGVVGLGLRLWQSSSRTVDRLGWKLSVKNDSLADAQFCRTYKGTETCKTTAKDISFSLTESNNFTINMQIGTTYISNFAWLNSKSLTTSARTELSSRYTQEGYLWVSAKGSATKSVNSMTIRSKTAVHVVLTKCMSSSAWSSFVSSLLGIKTSSVSSRGTGQDASCGSRRRAVVEQGIDEVFNEFEMLISDDEMSGTPSNALVKVLNDAISDGAATWSDITVSSLATTLPETSAGAFLVESSSVLSTGAIVGIAVGGGAALCVAGLSVAAVAARNRNRGEPSVPVAESSVPVPARRSFIRKLFAHDAVDVMNNPSKVHTSITSRAAPVEL